MKDGAQVRVRQSDECSGDLVNGSHSIQRFGNPI